MTGSRLDALHKQWLKRPAYKRAYKALEGEFNMASALIEARSHAGLTQEQLAFSLAADPRGYGDPDSGWHRVAGTNLVLAGPVPDAPDGLAVFAVSYGPASDTSDYAVTAEPTEDGVIISTTQFSALIGYPAGDEHGEPILTLTTPDEA